MMIVIFFGLNPDTAHFDCFESEEYFFHSFTHSYSIITYKQYNTNNYHSKYINTCMSGDLCGVVKSLILSLLVVVESGM